MQQLKEAPLSQQQQQQNAGNNFSATQFMRGLSYEKIWNF